MLGCPFVPLVADQESRVVNWRTGTHYWLLSFLGSILGSNVMRMHHINNWRSSRQVNRVIFYVHAWKCANWWSWGSMKVSRITRVTLNCLYDVVVLLLKEIWWCMQTITSVDDSAGPGYSQPRRHHKRGVGSLCSWEVYPAKVHSLFAQLEAFELLLQDALHSNNTRREITYLELTSLTNV